MFLPDFISKSTGEIKLIGSRPFRAAICCSNSVFLGTSGFLFNSFIP